MFIKMLKTLKIVKETVDSIYDITTVPEQDWGHAMDREVILSDKELEKAEEKIRKFPLLRFHPKIEGEVKSMKGFLVLFFCSRYDYGRRHYGNTYQDGELQCEGDRRRSFIDGYRTALSYFPDLKFSSFYKMLHENASRKGFYFFWCPDVKEYVFSYNDGYFEDEEEILFDHIDFKKYVIS